MSSLIYNSVQPESLKDSYGEYDTVDFVLNFENQSLVLDTLKLEGVLSIPDATNATIQDISLDHLVGMHSFIQTLTIETQNQGVIQNLTEYPRYVRQHADTNLANDDLFNSNMLVELRAPSNEIGKRMINGTGGNGNPDFSVKLQMCLNKSIGVNKFLGFSKTGSITIRMRLAPAVACLYGSNVTGTTTYALSNLKLCYTTLSMMDKNDKNPVVMESYIQLKQVVASGLANINTRVPGVCSGVSCSFIDVNHLNKTQYNSLATERLPNVQEVVFMFNDNTNQYITYPIKTPIEIQEHYIESMNITNHCEIDRSANTKFGIGLDFGQLIDLRNQKFNCQIKSDVDTEFLMFMYFSTVVSL